jgi:outer membrane protein OmpA-like peptidoglycan-associated protein
MLREKGEKKMKKSLVVAVFILFAAALAVHAEASKRILNIQKAYVFLEEALLISDTDLNCSYFIKDDMPRDIRIVSYFTPVSERTDYSDQDDLVVNRGSKDGLKEGDLLMIISEGQVIHHPRNHDRLGRYFLKKSLAEITCIYDHQAVIRLQKGCNPVNIGDFAILYKPEETLFTKKIDYKLCRIPANAISGMVVFTELTLGIPSEISGDSQYVSVDLGEGIVNKGAFLLLYRHVASDLPPMIIGLGIVIHSEKTNSTVKILDASTEIRINDRALVLPKITPGPAVQGEKENIPVVETVQPEGQEQPAEAAGGEAQGGALNIDVLFGFDSKTPIADHAADYAAIRDFIASKSEYLVTLRGYTCSIGGEEYNLRLSSQRVEAIKNLLVSQYGIDPAHIETFFYGEKEPQFDNSSEAERQKNRLVKIEVNGK